MNRTLLLALAASCAIACAPANNTGDSSTTPDASTTDVQISAEAGPEAGADTGGTVDYGTCGMSLRTCLCACASGNQACQQACLNNSNMACQQCVGMAQAGCCPAESAAVGMCGQMSMCTDQACLQTMCGTQITAFNTCIQMQSTMPACRSQIAMCVGDLVCP